MNVFDLVNQFNVVGSSADPRTRTVYYGDAADPIVARLLTEARKLGLTVRVEDDEEGSIIMRLHGSIENINLARANAGVT